MTSIPPLLPEEVLARVQRLARMDGLSVLLIASVFALVAAMNHEGAFAFVFLLGAGAGAMELHGAALLRHGDSRGMSWLIASQPFLLGVILAYCALRLAHFEVPPVPEMFRIPLDTTARELGLTVEEYLKIVAQVSVAILAVASLGVQGGMTLYYLRRRKAVARALELQ